MAQQLSPDDEGKPVVSANGEQLGTLLAVTDEEVLIAPSPQASDTPRQIVEGTDGGARSRVPPDRIEAVTEDTVRVDVSTAPDC